MNPKQIGKLLYLIQIVVISIDIHVFEQWFPTLGTQDIHQLKKLPHNKVIFTKNQVSISYLEELLL